MRGSTSSFLSLRISRRCEPPSPPSSSRSRASESGSSSHPRRSAEAVATKRRLMRLADFILANIETILERRKGKTKGSGKDKGVGERQRGQESINEQYNNINYD